MATSQIVSCKGCGERLFTHHTDDLGMESLEHDACDVRQETSPGGDLFQVWRCLKCGADNRFAQTKHTSH
jgi:RNase P subunit RPR2